MLLIFIINLYKNITLLCRTKRKQDIICHTPNILIPHNALVGKNIFHNTKGNNIHWVNLLQNKLYSFVNERHCASSCFNFLTLVAVWQKDHVMSDMKLDVQMEGGFNIWERLIKVP